MNICSKCRDEGTRVLAAFTEAEVSVLLAAACDFIRQSMEAMRDPKAPVEFKAQSEMGVPMGLAAAKKLLLAMPDNIRLEMMEFYKQTRGITFMFADCDTGEASPDPSGQNVKKGPWPGSVVH